MSGVLGDPGAVAGLGARLAALVEALDSAVSARLDAGGFADVRDTWPDLLAGIAAGAASPVRLAGRVGVTPQAVSKAARALADAGYLRRVADPADGRGTRFELTARGRGYLDAERRARQGAERALTRWLGTRDRAELDRLLTAALDRFSPDPTPGRLAPGPLRPRDAPGDA